MSLAEDPWEGLDQLRAGVEAAAPEMRLTALERERAEDAARPRGRPRR